MPTMADQLLAHIRSTSARIVGLAGAPGAGKSTVAHAVVDALGGGLVLSLDDFYLSRAERAERGLAWRGAPGSHDLDALLDVLDKLRDRVVPVALPRYSSAIDDRIDPVVLDQVPDLVIVEGWVLGHRADGYDQILDRLDTLVFIDVPIEVARARRFEREAKLRAAGGGFTEEQMQRFWDEVLQPGVTRWVAEAKAAADVVLSEP